MEYLIIYVYKNLSSTFLCKFKMCFLVMAFTSVYCIVNLMVSFHRLPAFFLAIAFWYLVMSPRWEFLLFPLMIFDVVHAAVVAGFNCIVVKVLLNLWHCENCFVISWRNIFVMFVDTNFLKGRLNRIIFGFHFFGLSDLLLAYFKSKW